MYSIFIRISTSSWIACNFGLPIQSSKPQYSHDCGGYIATANHPGHDKLQSLTAENVLDGVHIFRDAVSWEIQSKLALAGHTCYAYEVLTLLGG